MIAIFDAGNTNITTGIFNNDKIFHVYRIKTNLIQNKVKFIAELKSILRKYNVTDAFVGSVVPKATIILNETLKKHFNIRPEFINKNTKLNIKNKYKNKKEVGDDRIANAAAAAHYYKNQNVIVIDFGTAITFDVINQKAEYLGGLILPGINLCLRCLSENTARLPEVNMKKINKIIGNTTEKSILSGIKNGLTGAIKYITEEIKKEMKFSDTKIILTGGEADLIKIEIDPYQILDKNLTLKGFKIIFDLNKKE
ncbi:MAG TPA: type III pantothenate kinase [Candidatus Goldiibacteriota bacterium]|nr:type III pantothenate kinase [Candidatus Goldiibacteriota bacterium]